MSTAKAGIGIAGILAIAAILSIPTVGIALHEFRAQQRAQAALLAANQDYEARLAQLRAWEQKAQAVLSPLQYDALKSAYASVQVAQLQAQFAQQEKASGSP